MTSSKAGAIFHFSPGELIGKRQKLFVSSFFARKSTRDGEVICRKLPSLGTRSLGAAFLVPGSRAEMPGPLPLDWGATKEGVTIVFQQSAPSSPRYAVQISASQLCFRSIQKFTGEATTMKAIRPSLFHLALMGGISLPLGAWICAEESRSNAAMRSPGTCWPKLAITVRWVSSGFSLLTSSKAK